MSKEEDEISELLAKEEQKVDIMDDKTEEMLKDSNVEKDTFSKTCESMHKSLQDINEMLSQMVAWKKEEIRRREFGNRSPDFFFYEQEDDEKEEEEGKEKK